MSRRTLLGVSAGAAGAWALWRPLPGGAQTALEPTPACGSDHAPTPSSNEGPFFSPDSPERADITEGRFAGQDLLVGGYVLDTACRPVAGALVEIWQADPGGDYDNRGNLLRGHQYSDAAGRWLFTSVLPGPYGRRARHVHLKVQRPGGEVLTTQMFFPGDPAQAGDSQFNPRLLAELSSDQPHSARMDIVLG
ncbi:MAG: intradiol ring-cleavage dioxygenase [Rhodobacteraceae bacterium]|nr:intradiol ring-cleavage dioxygenase [Paracoccaceae bacterium]